MLHHAATFACCSGGVAISLPAAANRAIYSVREEKNFASDVRVSYAPVLSYVNRALCFRIIF